MFLSLEVISYFASLGSPGLAWCSVARVNLLYMRFACFILLAVTFFWDAKVSANESANESANQSVNQLGGTIDRLHIVIPGAAGGGWDRTARGTGEALSRSGLANTVTFENMSGGGGGKAIAHIIERKRPGTILVNSTPIVVRALRGVFPQSFRDLAPIASVIGDYSVIAVRKQSQYATIKDLQAALERDVRSVPIAGGSVYGGTDHIVAAMMAKSMGIAPTSIKYIPYDAGGKAMVGLLSGEVAALSSGYGEVVDLVEQGWVRLLCIASNERLGAAPETPTCNEAGVPGLVFVNWRGFFADKDTSPDQLLRYQTALAGMLKTEAWQEVRARYGWIDLYRPGEAFTQLLSEQELRLQTLLTELGML